MIFKYKFCLWLIDTLSNQPLTLEQIQKKWLYSSSNEDGDHLAERTFNRYRRLAESLMYVEIKCDKRNGNTYTIERPESLRNDELQQWLLSAFRLSSLSERVNQRDEVIIEQAPPGAFLLQTIMDAIDKKCTLRCLYKSHYKKAKTIELIPVFVRLYKQRWYVIGENRELNCPITCALERIKEIELIEDGKVEISSKLQPILNSTAYFEHCFGIIRQFEPTTIRFRAFWPQNEYIKDVPLHTSQEIINQTDDYTDFEIFVRPTYDLKQELLWHRDKLVVISPESFRKEMIQILEATIASYKTGECHSVDE